MIHRSTAPPLHHTITPSHHHTITPSHLRTISCRAATGAHTLTRPHDRDPFSRHAGAGPMKFAMIGAVLITLPAIAGLIYSLVAGNQYLMYAALASLGLNSLPF